MPEELVSSGMQARRIRVLLPPSGVVGNTLKPLRLIYSEETFVAGRYHPP